MIIPSVLNFLVRKTLRFGSDVASHKKWLLFSSLQFEYDKPCVFSASHTKREKITKRKFGKMKPEEV